MPPRRRRAPRKQMRRKAGRKAAKAIAANTKVDLKASYRVPYNFVATTGASVGTYAYSAYSPAHFNYSNLAAMSSEFTAQKQLFDEFCITGMTVKYTPMINVNNTSSTGGDARIHTVVDRDGTVPVSTSVSVPNKLQAYDSYKEFNIYKRWSRSVRCKSFWMDTGIASINPQAEAGTAQPWVNAGLTQVLVLYAQYLPPAAAPPYNLGTLTVVWNVKFRGKKTTAFGYDPVSGTVFMTPISSYPADIPITSEKVGLPGDDEKITCDMSGNLVVQSDYSGLTASIIGPDS